jgi:hypothetical protein
VKAERLAKTADADSRIATQWYWGQNYDITTANPGFES